MKAFFVLVLTCLLGFARAGNYYFSTILGNDSRTASQSQDPSTPWKTLDKLNSIFSTLRPGDSVLLKRGETFYGSILIKQSGLATSPIVIGAYGSGDRPVITSLVTLNSWVAKGNGIWESATPFTSGVNMVLLNGSEQEMGRYPNSDAPNKGYLNFESHVGTTSITDNDLNTSINWKGAELVTRPRHWILNRSLITGQSGHKISYTTTSRYEPYENYGYFIQNSIKTLDKLGEWYYNSSTKKLSAYFGSNGPASYVMQAATTTNDLISSTKCSNVIFDNLSLKGSNSSGFNITGGSGIHIQNCDILFSGVTGILVGGHLNLVVENCTISNSNTNAIDLQYGATNAIINNNKILNTALIPGLLQNGEGNGLGIYSNSDNNTIEYNEIRRTGFIGVTFYGSNVTIKNNFVDSFCFVKDDGGGLYTHGGAIKPTNRKLIGNIIINGVGAGPGTDNAQKRAVTGIYMDANTVNVEITGNTVTTCFQGILIQSTTGITIKNNTVFNNVRQMTMVRDKDNNPIRNSIITQNIFFSKSQIQWALYAMSSADDIKLFGKLDSNYYARPLDDGITLFTSYVGTKGTVTQNLDLTGWQNTYQQDKHSRKSAKEIEPYKIIGLTGVNKFIDGGDFTDDIKGLSGSSCTLTQATSGMLDGGYLQVVPTSPGSSVYMKIGSVTAGKNYILSYSLRGSVEGNMSIGASLKQTVSPYAAITPVQSRKIDKARTENQLLLTPATSEASANVLFKVDDQSKYYLDNIKFYQANAQITNPDDSITFHYNATATTKTVALNGSYIDTRGKKYSGNIVMQPYGSIILIKTGSAKNAAPAVTISTNDNRKAPAPFSSISFNAIASDVDGTIAKVEFYNGSTLLTTEYKPTYDCTISNIAPGKYSITARAYDNDGLSTTSSPISFTVPKVKVAPAVSITSPTVNSTFSASANINLIALATDTDGSISKVEFYNGSTLLTTEYKIPYTYSWQNVAAGTYTITAKATDNDGLSTTSAAIKVSVKAAQASKSSSLASAGLSNDSMAARGSGLESTPGNNSSLIENGTLLSQSDLSKLSDFTIAPNPAVSMIHVYFNGLQINQKATLSVRNLSGAIVKKYAVTITGEKIDVDISSLTPGLYIIGLSGNNFSINKKFIKAD